MALLTIRQKQKLFAWIFVPVAFLAYVVMLFRYLPWLAWPLAALIVGLVVWGVVKRNLKRTAHRPALKPATAPATLDVTVPFGPDDTVDSIALKFIDAANARGQRVSVAEARRVAEVELRKARGV
ncbi:hypothetical protein [Sinomonas atrocyanea]|uniref:hypothetical protein n=1 Tax=Sinomonas atrocyanea TaxID=37927 RepID=UPI002864B08C|nr:hypothetical protein [Sinomonas atrocyanea]MDR6623039.1 hypothetical protein [Sinomonas atrocyanea]